MKLTKQVSASILDHIHLTEINGSTLILGHIHRKFTTALLNSDLSHYFLNISLEDGGICE